MSLKQLSSTCRVSFLAAPATDHKHKFSLTHFIHFSHLSDGLTFAQTSPVNLEKYIPCDGPRQCGGSTGSEPKTVELKDIDAKAIDPEDLEPRRIELDGNLGADPYQIHERFVRNSITEDMDEFEKIGADVSYLQLQMQVRVRNRVHRGKLAALFSSGNEEPGNQLKSSIFKNADPSNLGRSLIEGNKDHLLSQARSELVRQEHQVGSLNDCISELQQHAVAQRLELQDAHHGRIESRREQFRLQEELSIEEKALRKVGETKRAQEFRVDEFSIQKLRESHETIQKLTSRLQEMQEQMNSTNMIQVGSSRSGTESQWEIVSRSQSTGSDSKSSIYAEPRPTLPTWHMEYVWITGKRSGQSIFYVRFVPKSSSRNSLLYDHQERQDQFHKRWGTGTSSARDEERNGSTIPMPTFAGRPSTVSSSMPVGFPQNSMVGQQRQQISELQFNKFPNPKSFLVWKIRFKNQVTTCSDFPSEAMLWIKEVDMVDSSEELKSSRSVSGKNFSTFETPDVKIASALPQDHPELPIQEEGQSRRTESP